MAAIRARKLADGSVSYTAQIRIKRAGVQVYQESHTFARKQAARARVAWTIREAAKIYAANELEPIQCRMLQLNSWFGKGL
jgi:hypothetical protein